MKARKGSKERKDTEGFLDHMGCLRLIENSTECRDSERERGGSIQGFENDEVKIDAKTGRTDDYR